MDKVTLRILLLILAVFEIAFIVGIFLLLSDSKNVPDAIWAASASVLTAMLGLAVPHDSTDQITAVAGAVSSAISSGTQQTVVPTANNSNEETSTDPGVIPANLGA